MERQRTVQGTRSFFRLPVCQLNHMRQLCLAKMLMSLCNEVLAAGAAVTQIQACSGLFLNLLLLQDTHVWLKAADRERANSDRAWMSTIRKLSTKRASGPESFP